MGQKLHKWKENMSKHEAGRLCMYGTSVTTYLNKEKKHCCIWLLLGSHNSHVYLLQLVSLEEIRITISLKFNWGKQRRFNECRWGVTYKSRWDSNVPVSLISPPNTDKESRKQHPWTTLHDLQTMQLIQEHALGSLAWFASSPISCLLFLHLGERPSWILYVSASPDMWSVFISWEPPAPSKKDPFRLEETCPRQQTFLGRWER